MRTFNLLKYLSEHHQLTCVTQYGEDLPQQEIEELQQWVKELVLFPATPQIQAPGGLLATAKQIKTFIKQGIPPAKELPAYSHELQDWMDLAVKMNQFDLITCEESHNEIYIRPQWQQSIPTVVNIHRSLYGTRKHQSQNSNHELQKQFNLSLLRWYEQQYSAKFSTIVTTSQEDRRILKTINPEADITVIPNGLDLSHYPKRPSNQGGQRLIFIGAMDKPANIDAACFLSLEIFPAICQRYPESTLEIVGTDPAPEVLALAELGGVKVTGQVASIVEYLHWATVCVIPVRKGSGIKHKTLEAMAAGIPVVASDIALEGLPVDGSGVPPRAMRANQVDEYVYGIGRLFEDPKLREKLSTNGRSLIESEYTWERMGQRYEQVLLNVQASKP